MKKEEIYLKLQELAHLLSKTNFDDLPISDYNKSYINKLSKAFYYYCRIYSDCLHRVLGNKNPQDLTLVDFGGGSGFLSLMAKSCGFKEVIYIDLNPLSVQTVTYLKSFFRLGPDIILTGDTTVLKKWAKENNVFPDVLIATDLIEHVYDLNPFFKDLSDINPSMEMIFTTASNPYNFIKNRTLKKCMKEAEFAGTSNNPSFYSLRLQYIKNIRSEWTRKEQSHWAKNTRGLIFEDIEKAMKGEKMPLPKDKYNTCDPRSGNWEERILSLKDYKKVLKEVDFTVTVYSGYYNDSSNTPLKSILCSFLNWFIKLTGNSPGLFLAPFIFLHIKKDTNF